MDQLSKELIEVCFLNNGHLHMLLRDLEVRTFVIAHLIMSIN